MTVPVQHSAALLTFVEHGDCERLGSGLLAEPANAWSALAFVVVGVAVIASRGRDRIPFGAAILLIGAGSFLFHREATDLSAWLDTFGVAAFVLVLIARNLGWIDGRLAIGAALAAIAVWWLDTALVVVLIATAAATEYLAWRRGAERDRRLLGSAAALYAAGLVVFALTRSDGPWCHPDTLLQGHAVWHVMAAGVVALLFAYFASEPAT